MAGFVVVVIIGMVVVVVASSDESPVSDAGRVAGGIVVETGDVVTVVGSVVGDGRQEPGAGSPST